MPCLLKSFIYLLRFKDWVGLIFYSNPQVALVFSCPLALDLIISWLKCVNFYLCFFLSTCCGEGDVLFILNTKSLILFSSAFSFASHVSNSRHCRKFHMFVPFLQLRLWHRRVGDRGYSFAKVRIWPYLLFLTPVRVLSEDNIEMPAVPWSWFKGPTLPYHGRYDPGSATLLSCPTPTLHSYCWSSL